MAIVKRSIVSQMVIERNGLMSIRFGLTLIDDEDDNQELASQWHRMIIEPGDSVDAKFNELNAWLTTNSYASTVTGERNRVKAVVAIVHTAGVINAYADWKAAQQPPGGGGA